MQRVRARNELEEKVDLLFSRGRDDAARIAFKGDGLSEQELRTLRAHSLLVLTAYHKLAERRGCTLDEITPEEASEGAIHAFCWIYGGTPAQVKKNISDINYKILQYHQETLDPIVC